MGFIDFTLDPTGEQENEPSGRHGRIARALDRNRRWARRLALTATIAGSVLAIRRLRNRRDDSEFTRIEIEGESAAVDR